MIELRNVPMCGHTFQGTCAAPEHQAGVGIDRLTCVEPSELDESRTHALGTEAESVIVEGTRHKAQRSLVKDDLQAALGKPITELDVFQGAETFIESAFAEEEFPLGGDSAYPEVPEIQHLSMAKLRV